MCPGRRGGLRLPVVRRAPLSDRFLRLSVPRGHLGRPQPAYQTDTTGARSGYPAVPPPRPRGRAGGHAGPLVAGQGRFRDGTVRRLRGRGHGHRPAGYPRHVEGVPDHDSQDLGIGLVLVGGPLLAGPISTGAAQALPKAPPPPSGWPPFRTPPTISRPRRASGCWHSGPTPRPTSSPTCVPTRRRCAGPIRWVP